MKCENCMFWDRDKNFTKVRLYFKPTNNDYDDHSTSHYVSNKDLKKAVKEVVDEVMEYFKDNFEYSHFEVSKEHFGDCLNNKLAYREEIDTDEDIPNDFLIYWDGEGYSAGMKTGADFGCIHYEARDN